MDQEFIEKLRRAVEEKAGCTLRTPRDYDYLHQLIFEQEGIMVSTSTLKRIWGYVKSDSQPRPSSLDLLARYAGYADYHAFQKTQQVLSADESAVQRPTKESLQRHQWRRYVLLLLVALLGIGCYFWLSLSSTSLQMPMMSSGKRVLHKGDDCFRVIEDYLSLFGIEPGDTDYFRPVPNLEHVYVWSPEYGHPVWHNEGDSLQLMPAIHGIDQPRCPRRAHPPGRDDRERHAAADDRAQLRLHRRIYARPSDARQGSGLRSGTRLPRPAL